MIRKLKLVAVLISFISLVYAQETIQIPLPKDLTQGYPRLYITQAEKENLEETIQQEEWAQDVLAGIHKKIDTHVKRHVKDPEWMPSRLMMYWKTKATNVYVNGIYYSHADGEAPVPTVRYTGSRDYTTNYAMPDLEDILPYMDDERGLYLHNKSKEGNPLEWVEQSKTGGILHRHNEKLLGFARDAAFLYWLEGDERFAKFAFDIFDTYMMGMYYRNEPIDLLNGHIQTLVGMTCFQVIHEKGLIVVAELYDFLHQYIVKNEPEKIALYDATIKKWNENIIRNGVPQNNWNLHQAKTILKGAMVLKDNKFYEDGKGREYYIDYILNQTSARQWSLTKFMDYGYDENNGVWAECPGYSQGVTKDLTNFIRDFDNAFDHNILPYAPVMERAVKMLPQYLFPNGQIVAFGDTNYGPLYTEPMSDMVRIAQKNGNESLEEEFTAMYRLFEPNADKPAQQRRPRANISSFFASKPLELNPKYNKAKREDYVTQTFYAPNVSWHVQRMGWGTDAMMVSMNGSLGNHMHANGINIELYGKGLVQGADPGKGAGYLQPIYLEYYSQFPAHNTVMVDGASSYTEMLSYHAFDLMGEYPRSEQKSGYYPNITYSDVYFLEPETRSDQNRMVSIVKTGETTGYYVDIFRSKKQRKGDKFHDYYYHNLGQSMQVTDTKGNQLELTPSEEMGFAGGHLYAMDYMWDKKSIHTSEDYVAEWKIDRAEGEADVFMNLWMKGTEGREVYTVKSPPCKSFKDKTGIPYDVDHEPYLTLVARQHGEAWEHPFISVYEPFTSDDGKSIESILGFEDENGATDFAGIQVINKSGRKDYIFSTYDQKTAKYKNMQTDATYALVGNEKNGDFVLFMGNGTRLIANGLIFSAKEKGNLVFEQKGDVMYLNNEMSVTIISENREMKFDKGDYREVQFE
ncbi:six-hairpin glycosidase [uncultured Draconibacterium sp.]|uniref:six-hairpin glycosidase n=1 Tax=uncultured Draconibacterium sp. TaxID=1573823 RepID=UPI002AA6D50D|nr:six-hairpin glycosidase [uncultured Draconibacterium sp.]